MSSFFKTELNHSKFGIGLNISKSAPVSSLDAALKIILIELNKKEKRILVTVDISDVMLHKRRYGT